MQKSCFLVFFDRKLVGAIVWIAVLFIIYSFKPANLENFHKLNAFSTIQPLETDTTKRATIEPPIKLPTRPGEEALAASLGKLEMEDKLSGKDSSGEDYYDFVATPSIPPGGLDGWSQFLGENLKYPAEAVENGISGTVIATFIVKKDGSISDLEILRGIGGGCDEELIRVLNKSPKWTPGKLKSGEVVNTKIRMPVRFR
jgi:TonB family protein